MKISPFAFLLSGALIANGADAVVIDEFASGPFDFTITGPVPPPVTDSRTNTGLANNLTIGGSRHVEGILFVADAGEEDEARIRRVSSQGGALDIANTAGADSSVSVRWDANGHGLGGVNITAGRDSYFFFSFPVPIGNEEMSLTLTVNTTGGERKRTVSVRKESTSISMPFADFSGTGSFTSVNWIVMVLDAEKQWDARVSLVETRGTAPVPGTLVLMGIGLAALTGRGRRA